MGFSVVGWQESVDNGGVLAPLNAITDNHITTLGDDIVVSSENILIGGAAYMSADATRVNLQSPSLRRVCPFEVTPVTLAITPTDNNNMRIPYDNGVPLETNEALQGWENGNTASVHTILAWLCDAKPQPVMGKMISIPFTATITAVVGAWVGAQIALTTDLPTGKYPVIGAGVVGANGVAFRFNPIGSINRPGGIVSQLVSDPNKLPFRFGYLGKWFDLDTVQLPQMEIVAMVAGAITFQGVLDILI